MQIFVITFILVIFAKSFAFRVSETGGGGGPAGSYTAGALKVSCEQELEMVHAESAMWDRWTWKSLLEWGA